MRRTQHDILFEPVHVGSKVFRNRFFSVPHASFHPGRRMSDIAFRRIKAEGGWAAVSGGVVSLRRDSWGGFVPRIWDPTDREVLRRMAAEIQGQGALAAIELGHGGAMGEGEKFTPSLGVSQLADPDRGRFVPKEMTLRDIRQLQDDWTAAGIMAADLGYDIVYAYGAHGYVPAQFLSPYLNRRTDAYGGTLENRARFWIELIERLRIAIGDRCIIAVRIAAENFSPYAVSADDTLQFIAMVDDLVDLWDVNVGHQWARDSAHWRLAAEGSQLEWSGRVRSVTSKPIIGVSRLTNPDAMADIIRSGAWDFIGGARPGIADPFLPQKIEAGRYEDLRECTGSNFCIAAETSSAGLSCVQNPTIGEEYRRSWHPERVPPAIDPSQHVLVVGAGPAGMECARVLGERGFANVHLVDSTGAMGGHVRWHRELAGLGGLGRVIDYRTTQIGKLDNVTFVPHTRLDAQQVIAYGADLVVIATGARWIDESSELHRLPLGEFVANGMAMMTPEDIMVDGIAPLGPVLIWDGEGTAVGVGIAERIAAANRSRGVDEGVTIATGFPTLAPSLDASFDGFVARQRLHELGVEMVTGARPTHAAPGKVTFTDIFGNQTDIAVRSMVLVSQRASDNALYRAVMEAHLCGRANGIRTVTRIGDCVSPRQLGFVIGDAHRMGRELDTESPEVPATPRTESDSDATAGSFDSPPDRRW